MLGAVKAVIFDMDGVLIDSEPLWRKCMIKGFGDVGLLFTEEDCRKTTGQRFTEVVSWWVVHHTITQKTVAEIEKHIIDLLIESIHKEGKAIQGALEVLAFCKKQELKLGLATSSSNNIMQAVLAKLHLTNTFDACISAEGMKYGKPNPEVFLTCSNALGVLPGNCMVIEDSINGVIAAKAAQMFTIALPDLEHKHLPQFSIADTIGNNMEEVIGCIQSRIDFKFN